MNYEFSLANRIPEQCTRKAIEVTYVRVNKS